VTGLFLKTPEALIQPEIVGRETELGQLRQILQSAFQGKGRAVFVSGEAGAGKTSLVNEFLKKARKDGVIILSGRCLSNAAVPYFPFFEAFNSFFDSQESKTGPKTDATSSDHDVLNLLMGPTRQRSEDGLFSAQSWKDQTFTSVMKALSLITEDKPVILFIDDLQWADSASLTLLHYIARFAESKKVIVLSTFRSEEVLSDAEGRSSLLLETLRVMGREDLCVQIKLPSLNLLHVSKIIENMLGGKVSSELIEMLNNEGSGNPLYIVESIKMLSERKNLVRENDEWRLTVDTLTIPNKIKEIILRRLGWVKSSQRRVLDAASVIGDKFDVDLVSLVLNQDALEVLDTLNVVAQSTSLVLVDGDCYRFNHAKSREAIYEDIPSPLRKAYHLRIAQKLEEKQKGTQSLADIAYHYTQAGNKEKSVQFAFLAGKDALARWSNQEAINHFKYVLGNLPSANKELNGTVKEALGDAYYANCIFEEAYKVFIELANSEIGSIRLRAYRKAIDSIFRKNEHKRLMDIVTQAERYVSSDPLENARILWSRARAEAFTGNVALSLKHHEQALQIFEEEYSLPDVAQVLCGTGSHHTFMNNHKKALQMILRSVALFQELNDYEGELNASQSAAMGFAFAGLREESRRRWFGVLELSKRLNHYSYMGFAYFAIANGFETVENFEEALPNALQVIECSKKTDNKLYLISAYASLSRLYGRLGNIQLAEEYLAKLIDSKFEMGAWMPFYIESSRAIICAIQSHWEEAEQYFQKTFELLKQIGNSAAWDRRIRRHYIWSLKMQGKNEDAEKQLKIIASGLESVEKIFGEASLKSTLMVKRQVQVGAELELRLDLVNIGKKPASLVTIQNLFLGDFKIKNLPSYCQIENGVLTIKNREIGSFQVDTTRIAIKALRSGTFVLSPIGTYSNGLGEEKKIEIQPVMIKVAYNEDGLTGPRKVPFGYPALDKLLMGGIPEKYAVVLAAATSDQEEMLTKNFLETGLEQNEAILYITNKAETAKKLSENYSMDFYGIVCNPQVDTAIPATSKIIKLKGVENLTEIDIALTKALRTINQENGLKKRACIGILSDVLLQHHAVNTRKWLSGMLLTLKSKGFTTLAVINPLMHSTEEIEAILSQFDGEIELIDKGQEKVLKIRRLHGQTLQGKEALLK
jgi:tetratricopeptide (TPR) repeat protein